MGNKNVQQCRIAGCSPHDTYITTDSTTNVFVAESRSDIYKFVVEVGGNTHNIRAATCMRHWCMTSFTILLPMYFTSPSQVFAAQYGLSALPPPLPSFLT